MPYTEGGSPYLNDTTSKEAAEANDKASKKGFVASCRMRVANLIHSTTQRVDEDGVSEGLTDDEGEVILGLNSQTYMPRRRELSERGLVEDSGARRKTRKGCKAIVWVSTVRMTRGVLNTGSVKDISKISLFRR